MTQEKKDKINDLDFISLIGLAKLAIQSEGSVAGLLAGLSVLSPKTNILISGDKFIVLITDNDFFDEAALSGLNVPEIEHHGSLLDLKDVIAAIEILTGTTRPQINPNAIKTNSTPELPINQECSAVSDCKGVLT